MAIKTKEQLKAYADTYRNTNGSQAMTGATENVMWNDVVDSMGLAGGMFWKGEWTPGTYETNDVVRDGAYLTVANKQTDDRPAPQSIGSQLWLYGTTPVWTPDTYTGTVWTGVRATPPSNTLWQISSIRAWISDTSTDAKYRVVVVNNLTGTSKFGSEFTGSVLTSPDWFTVAIDPTFISGGDDYTFYLVTHNTATTTNFNYPWNWIGTSNQNNDPGTGNVESNNGQVVLRINYNDDDGISRLTDLNSVILGASIRVAEEGNLGNYNRYVVNGINDGGTYKYFDVSLDDVGGGGPGTGTRCAVAFEVPVAQPAEYVIATDYFLNNDNLSGQIALDNGAPSTTNNGYGIDIQLEQFSTSSDWDFMAISGGSGGSGGGTGWVPSYIFDKSTANTITAEHPAWEEINRLDYVVVDNSTYEFKISVTYTYDATTRSAYLRFSTDNGVTWNEFRAEPKDVTDARAVFYAFPIAYTTGKSDTFLLEAAKENAADTMIVNYADIIVDKKLG